MLAPKKIKWRKAFKGRIKGVATSGHTLVFGEYGLKAMEPERITSKQIESARRAMSRCTKRIGKIWTRIFPDVPVTSKPAEVRMGSGKGGFDRWVCRIMPGKMLLELDGMPEDMARLACALASAKLPIKTRFVIRERGL